MRKLLVALAVVALFPVAQASADSLKVGDIISFGPGTRGGTDGGEFYVYLAGHSGPILFGTFCVETDRYLDFQDDFMVGGISTVAMNDGNPLHNGTAYLYAQWSSGTITHNSADATDVQNAIWRFEGEGGVANSLYITTYNLPGIGSLTNNLGDVRVINLLAKDSTGAYTIDAQDILMMDPAVPEPASLLLLGTGLVGLARWRKRRH